MNSNYEAMNQNGDFEMNNNIDEAIHRNGGTMKRFLNVREAAIYLVLSETAIYIFIEWGMITHHRLPSVPCKNSRENKRKGKIVFEIQALDDFVESQGEKIEQCCRMSIKEKNLDNVN